jgi:hypothetical protein
VPVIAKKVTPPPPNVLPVWAGEESKSDIIHTNMPDKLKGEILECFGNCDYLIKLTFDFLFFVV